MTSVFNQHLEADTIPYSIWTCMLTGPVPFAACPLPLHDDRDQLAQHGRGGTCGDCGQHGDLLLPPLAQLHGHFHQVGDPISIR